MDIFYLDEAGDVRFSERGTRTFVLSTLAVPEESWNEVFARVQNFRRDIKATFGIPLGLSQAS